MRCTNRRSSPGLATQADAVESRGARANGSSLIGRVHHVCRAAARMKLPSLHVAPRTRVALPTLKVTSWFVAQGTLIWAPLQCRSWRQSPFLSRNAHLRMARHLVSHWVPSHAAQRRCGGDGMSFGSLQKSQTHYHYALVVPE